MHCTVGVRKFRIVLPRTSHVFFFPASADIFKFSFERALKRRRAMQHRANLLVEVMRIWRLAPRFWVPFGMTNFAFTPVNLRPIVTSLATIPWTM